MSDDSSGWKAGEFVRRIKRLGKEREVAVRFERKRGKGSHGTLYYGETGRTIVQDLKKELPTGTLHPMLDAARPHEGGSRVMRQFAYPVTLAPEKAGGFTVRFRDLPEAITSGEDRADALVQAADCLEEAIAGRIADGLDIPEASSGGRRQVLVPVAPLIAAKAALYLASREAGLPNVAIARRLGCDEKEVRRILDPRHPTKLPRIQQALAALGKRLTVAVEDAA